MTKLQNVQNSASRRITRQRKHQHITPLLLTLHWLPVSWRVHGHITGTCGFFALHGLAPRYLQDLVMPESPNSNLRDADQRLFVVPRFNLEGFGSRPSRCLDQLFGRVCLKTFVFQKL